MLERTILFPKSLKSDIDGYNFLAELCFKTRLVSNICFNLENTYWIDAHLCSPIAAIIYRLNQAKSEVKFINVKSNIQDILNRNHFASQFMSSKIQEDTKETTISCSRFNLDDKESFKSFVDINLLSKPNFPKISPELKKEINKCILEIYINAHIHGACDCVYTCGQYYPALRTLHLTIADMGSTIRKNVNTHLKTKINGAKAIQWAVEEGNTTRTGSIPGGLGFSLIRDFLKLNSGAIEIVSSNGFWHEEKNNTKIENLNATFLGTIINFEFNLDDKNSYILASEINPKEIF